MFKKDLDGILRGFHKTLSDLKDLTEKNKQEIDTHGETINKLDPRRQVLHVENQKAGSIIGNIEKLLEIA